MAESIRSVVVKVEVDTNKQTYERRLVWSEDETLEQFEQRVTEAINHLTELS
jgi:hypothetical protein